MDLLVGDPLVSGSLKAPFYEYVQTEEKEKDISGREKVVNIKAYWGTMAALNPNPKWDYMKIQLSY